MRTVRSILISLSLLVVAVACNAPTPAVTRPLPTAPPAATGLPVEPAAAPTELPTLTPTPAAATASPAALRVAYIVDGDLWAIELGSDPVRLTSSGLAIELRISDDGQRIVYLELNRAAEPADFRFDLRSIQFDGAGDRSLLNQTGFDALYPLEEILHYAPSQLTMVPGSHRLLLNTRAVLDGPGLAKNNDLIQLDTDTGEMTLLLARGDGGDFTPSPDGSQLAIVRPDSIGFANRDGGQLRPEVLSFPWVITYSEYFFYPQPVWAGNAVLAAIPAEDPFFGPEQGSFWHVPSDGSEPVLLGTPDADLFAPQQAGRALVSPDGLRAVFYRQPDPLSSYQLWVYDLIEGSGALYDDDVTSWMGWAPDSVHFLFGRGNAAELQLGELGAPPVLLGNATMVRWVDAHQLLWLAESGGSWRFQLRSLSGDSTDLTIGPGDFVAYDFAD